MGIFLYWQIAGLRPAAAQRIGEEVGLPGRMDGWIAHAKQLTTE
jgi:small subunit ribosomal protein S2